MKIKVRLYEGASLPVIHEQGDWYYIVTPCEVNLHCPISKTLKKKKKDSDIERYRDVEFKDKKISLQFCLELPKGYEAVVLPRSSTFRKYGIQIANTQGVIDQSYIGDNDIWQLHVLPFKTVKIPANTPILQFRIQLSQRATIWQKIKWLFCNGKVEFIEVPSLNNKNRGGDGSTDK